MNRQDAKTPRIQTTQEPRRVQEPDAETDALAYAVIGAAIEVHRALGPGWLESVYEEALAVELDLRNIAFLQQHHVALMHKSHAVGKGKIDFLVSDRLVVELKAVDALAGIRTAQVLSYLRVTGCKLGLLINFHVPVLRNGVERVALTFL